MTRSQIAVTILILVGLTIEVHAQNKVDFTTGYPKTGESAGSSISIKGKVTVATGWSIKSIN